jgi:hypothetical protein
MLPGLWNSLEPLKLTIIRFEGTINRNATPKMPALVSPLKDIVFSSRLIRAPTIVITG